MNNEDIDLKILRGSPIDVGVGKLYPLTIGEISDIGESEYNRCISVTTILQDKLEFEGQKLTHFETTIVYCAQSPEFNEVFLKALNIFFKEKVHFYRDGGIFYLGELEDRRFIDEEKFNHMKTVIKKQNFIKDDLEEKEFKPANDKAKELIEKMKQVKSKIKQQNNDDGLNIGDIVSIVAAHTPNVSIFSVWDLTVFQLYNLYLRLILKDTYESNFYLLPHTSDSKSLDLKHWATKIQK